VKPPLLRKQVVAAGYSPEIKTPPGVAAVPLLAFALLRGGSATRICGDLMAFIEGRRSVSAPPSLSNF
jgi:hypothetical protein